jgi:hypothetical protein
MTVTTSRNIYVAPDTRASSAPSATNRAGNGALAELRFDQTISRHLVHRAAVSEVLVTDAARLDADRYAVAAQLPRGHSLFNDGNGEYHDLLALAESVRQAGTLLAHEYEGVPLGHVFPLRTAEIDIDDVDALRAGPDPAPLVARISMTDPQRRDGQLIALTVKADIHVEGRRVGTGGGAMYFVEPGSYATFRPPAAHATGAPPPVAPVSPGRVGRANGRNVVIGEPDEGPGSPIHYPLVVDTGHPFFFDHPQDHVPGMLLLEAFRQAALITVAEGLAVPVSQCVVVSCRARFTSYAELDHRVTCRVATDRPILPPSGPLQVAVDATMVQSGAERAGARLRVAVLDRGR